MFLAQEGPRDHESEEGEQRVVIASGIEQLAGFRVLAELCPGLHLEELFRGTVATGQGDETIGELGHQCLALAQDGITQVYGGGRVGLTGVIADAVLGAGGEAMGVIPEALLEREIGHAGLTDLRVVGSMRERPAEPNDAGCIGRVITGTRTAEDADAPQEARIPQYLRTRMATATISRALRMRGRLASCTGPGSGRSSRSGSRR